MTTQLKYITTREAAHQLGLHDSRIRHLIVEGRIEGAVKPGRDWLIPSPVQVRPVKRGRPFARKQA